MVQAPHECMTTYSSSGHSWDKSYDIIRVIASSLCMARKLNIYMEM